MKTCRHDCAIRIDGRKKQQQRHATKPGKHDDKGSGDSHDGHVRLAAVAATRADEVVQKGREHEEETHASHRKADNDCAATTDQQVYS